jgi:hypothetical protein
MYERCRRRSMIKGYGKIKQEIYEAFDKILKFPRAKNEKQLIRECLICLQNRTKLLLS